MKNLIKNLAVTVLFSCSGREEQASSNILENLTFSVDTMRMDTGDSLVSLRFGASRSDVSKDKKTFYLVDPSTAVLSVFDLDKRTLEKQVKFESEGPNGVGSMIADFHQIDGGRVFITDFRKLGIFDLNAVKLSDLGFNPKNFAGLTEEEAHTLIVRPQYNPTQRKLVSLPEDLVRKKLGAALFDEKTGEGKMLDLPEFDFLSGFSLILTEGNSYNVANTAARNLVMEETRVLIYSYGTSSVYAYDLVKDSLTFKSYQFNLVASQQIAPESSNFSSKEKFDAALNDLTHQISFGEPFYDKRRALYFRFGSIPRPQTHPDSPFVSDVFLFVFDQTLELVGEAKMDELTRVPSTPFFKDGKLWSYVNVEDELGFAVFTFDF